MRYQTNGEKIKACRVALGLTQDQVARRTGYSVKTVGKAESGRVLRRQTIVDIAQVLGVRFQELVIALESVPREQIVARNQALMLDFLHAVERSDLDDCLSRLAENAVYSFPGPSSIPYCGTFVGRTQIEEFQRNAFKYTKYGHPKVVQLVAQDDFVDLHISVTHCSPKTGRTFVYPMVVHVEIRDGWVTKLQQIADYGGLIEFYADEGGPYGPFPPGDEW